MTLTEVIADLDMVSAYYPGDSERLDAVRAHLHSYTQPITPEGLEARGFEEHGVGQADKRATYWWRHFPSGEALCFSRSSTPEWVLHPAGREERGGDCDPEADWYVTPLPGVRTLGDVDDLIRMLEGGE